MFFRDVYFSPHFMSDFLYEGLIADCEELDMIENRIDYIDNHLDILYEWQKFKIICKY